MKKMMLISVLVILKVCLFGQNIDLPPNAIAGKCYAKCIPGEDFNITQVTYTLYYGDDLSTSNIDSIIYFDTKTYGKIILNPVDKSEFESIITFPENETIAYFKKDISLSADQKPDTFNVITQIISPASDWDEVLCEGKRTSKLIKAIQSKLISSNYFFGDIDGNYDEFTKVALKHYQRDNNLKIGDLYIETLKHLEIKYIR